MQEDWYKKIWTEKWEGQKKKEDMQRNHRNKLIYRFNDSCYIHCLYCCHYGFVINQKNSETVFLFQYLLRCSDWPCKQYWMILSVSGDPEGTQTQTASIQFCPAFPRGIQCSHPPNQKTKRHLFFPFPSRTIAYSIYSINLWVKMERK